MAVPAPAWRRLLDLWGFVPGYAEPHERVHFAARDGVRIAAVYLPGPAAAAPALVIAPGFGAFAAKPRYAYLAERLSATHAVLVLDPRGHGQSGGACTFGDREALDVRAGAAWLRCRGHAWIAAVGMSMGATAAIRAAGSGGMGVFDALVTVSAAAVWVPDESPATRLLTRLASRPLSRGAARLLMRTRIAARFADDLPTPLEVITKVPGVPLLVVHGADDHFFGQHHAHRLAGASIGETALWLEPSFGHAEDGITGAFAERLAAALTAIRERGRWA